MRSKRTVILGTLALLGLFLFSLAGWLYLRRDTPIALSPASNKPDLQKQSARISASQSGLVKINHQQLRSIGFQNQEQQAWHLTYRGIEIPFWMSDSGETADLVFYVPPTNSDYTRNAYFILSPKTSSVFKKDKAVYQSLKLMDLASILQKIPPAIHDGILVPAVFGEDKLYQPLAESDDWFWERLVSPFEKEIPIDIDQVVLDKAYLRVNLWASTSAAVTPDHHYQLKFNGTTVADEAWDGAGYHQIEAVIDANYFKKGSNTLSIKGDLPPQIVVDIVYLDTIELYTWQKPSLPNNKALIFGVADGGFPSPDSLRLGKQDWWLDITSPLSPTLVNRTSPIETKNHLFLAAKASAVQNISGMDSISIKKGDEPAAHNHADYLMIGPQDLLDPLSPLIEKRRSEGFTVETQDVAAIYAQYGGYPEPNAIRQYLQEVTSQNPNLKYVLLVGDSTYDPKGLANDTTMNRLPTFFIQTLYGGKTSSELPFAVMNPEGLDFLQNSDHYSLALAVGRLPAQNSQQVANWVKKMLAYENQVNISSPLKVVAVADPQGDMFAGEAQTFLDLWGGSAQKELYTPPAGTTEAAQVIDKYFQSGTTVLGYFGHGSIEMWGKDQLFTSNEAAKLTNSPSFPLVIQMTCLTGYYIHPKLESLSEALLWNPNGGAVAIIAPSSLTLPNDQGFLTKSLVEHFLKSNHDRIGDIWMQTLREIDLSSQGVRDVLATYTLLGDPTVIVR